VGDSKGFGGQWSSLETGVRPILMFQVKLFEFSFFAFVLFEDLSRN
jgi:hypothetical protein